MTENPGFDPYEVLGVSLDADVVVIQLAYRARVRAAHPDIAGAAGLEQTKRLNVARDWLLDPALRAQLPQHRAAAGSRAAPTGSRQRAGRNRHERTSADPFAFDFGPRTQHLREFLHAVGALNPDERARVNYSLGDTVPVFFERYRDYIEPRLWSRAHVLRDAVSVLWDRGVDEPPPFVVSMGNLTQSGFHVANAYAQWLLLGDFFRRELGAAVFRSEHVVESFADRCTDPWAASVRQPRYGPHHRRVTSFLDAARVLPADAAERLAQSWSRHLGRDGLGNRSDTIGPGVWLPAPANYPEVLKVSGYVAAVDASAIQPPEGLDPRLRGTFQYGLRLSASVLALGLNDRQARAYMRPWRDAVGSDRSLRTRVMAWMPGSETLGAR